jgi:hypothetical protein
LTPATTLQPLVGRLKAGCKGASPTLCSTELEPFTASRGATMSRTHSLTRALTAALATSALAAPVALAQPIDRNGTGTAQADVRSLDATGAVDPTRGQPTWPLNPQPIEVSNTAPVGDGDGSDWATFGLGLAGAGLIAGGATARAGRTRRRTRQAGVAA